MTTKAAFNAEDWSVVVNAPYLVALLMITASRGGNLRETAAVSAAYAGAREHYQGELLQQVLTSPPAFGPATPPPGPDELRAQVPSTLDRAVSILERAATKDEVNDYKRFVYYLAESVARAHREGGFLGIGGKEISEPEQALLDQIAAAFDEPSAAAGPSAS